MKKEADNNRQNPTDRRFRVIPVILAAKNISEGVKAAKISRDTFYEYLKDPAFKAEFVKQRREIVDLALHELKAAAGEAVAVLRKLLTARHEVIRLRTALGILEHISKFIQHEELEQRITELERKKKQ